MGTALLLDVASALRGVKSTRSSRRPAEYIRQRSALEDFKIMLLTPAVMLGQR
jgi:hypothetical protein